MKICHLPEYEKVIIYVMMIINEEEINNLRGREREREGRIDTEGVEKGRGKG